jgi:ribose 1,5-bisphosphokinase
MLTPSSKSTAESGLLVLVVGPSGVGKDTLLDGARSALAGDDRFVFARREITRPAGAGGEDHIAVDDASFSERERSGHYALSWRANGLAYGVPAGIAGDLALGRTIVVNGSRAIVSEARSRFTRIRVILVDADRDLLVQRLAERGRETAAEIAARLERAPDVDMSGGDVIVVRNDGTPAEGVALLVAALRG